MSASYIKALDAARADADPEPTSENPDHLELDLKRVAAICALHQELPPPAANWPTSPDFTSIESRLLQLRPDLQAVVNGAPTHRSIEKFRYSFKGSDRMAASDNMHAG